MTPLLTKTLRWYVIFAAVILLVTAPVFYYVTRHLYIDEANETLRLRKKEFLHYHQPKLKEADIVNWNHYNRDEKILPRDRRLKRDRFITTFYYDTLSEENEPYRVLRSPVTIEGQPYVFFAKINLVEKEDMMKSIALVFLVLMVSLLTGLYFITRILSIRLWKPFYNGLAHLEKFEVDKSISTTLTPTDINEFNRLNMAIENLIRKNKVIYNDQKEFIENAAHELQTPLAVIQGKLEALFLQSNLTQSQSEVLEKLSSAVTRMIRLNKNLLLLSRIEHDQFSESENISINDLLKKQFEFFYEQAVSRRIHIRVDEKKSVTVNANPTLTEVLVSNLFYNAVKHSFEGGNVLITLDEGILSIANTGTAPLPEQKIFERFSKINPSTQGSGLGLAIVRKVADINGWKISYAFENNLHLFRVNF